MALPLRPPLNSLHHAAYTNSSESEMTISILARLNVSYQRMVTWRAFSELVRRFSTHTNRAYKKVTCPQICCPLPLTASTMAAVALCIIILTLTLINLVASSLNPLLRLVHRRKWEVSFYSFIGHGIQVDLVSVLIGAVSRFPFASLIILRVTLVIQASFDVARSAHVSREFVTQSFWANLILKIAVLLIQLSKFGLLVTSCILSDIPTPRASRRLTAIIGPSHLEVLCS